MSEGRNLVILLGNLGADPELRFGNGPDNAVLKLRIATTESYFDKRSNERKERTDWHSVVVFGKRGEALQKILTKGSSVFIEGRLQTSSYEKDGQKVWRTDVVATNVILAGGRRDGTAPRESNGNGGGRSQSAPRQQATPSFSDDSEFAPSASGDDDDIPFARAR